MDKQGKNQEPFFFGQEGRKLYGVLHSPSSNDPARTHKKTGIVICPSFADEFTKSYGHMALWARKLSGLGYQVLRFHYYGTGDSGGDFSAVTITGMASDIQEASRFLRKKAGVREIGLFGFRLGATLAARAACSEFNEPEINFLVLWSPVVKTKSFIGSFLRLRIAKEMIHQKESDVKFTRADMVKTLEEGGEVDVIGYAVSSELYRQMAYSDPWQDITNLPERTLALCRKKEEAQMRQLFERLETLSPHIELKPVDERNFWDSNNDDLAYHPENFSRETVKWLSDIHGELSKSTVYTHVETSSDPVNDLSGQGIYTQLSSANIQESIEENVFKFPTRDGLSLTGIIHTPSFPLTGKKTGVVVLNGGMRSIPSKSGPHRLFLKGARELSLRGFHVLRFDYRGTGDSEGELYAPALMSERVSDTLEIIEYFRESSELEKVIIWGQCGGATLAMHCAALLAEQNQAQRVDGLILSSPLFSAGRLRRRLINKRNLFKLLTLSTEVRKNIKLIPKEIIKSLFPSASRERSEWKSLVDGFMDDFAAYDGNVLFTLGDMDDLYSYFSEELENALTRRRVSGSRSAPRICIVEGGDHNYASADQERILIEEMMTWLGETFGDIKPGSEQKSAGSLS